MNPEQLPLRDLHLPEAIGGWPLATGWWVLIGLLVAGLMLLARRGYLQYRRNAARRYALRELARTRHAYDADGNMVVLGVRLSGLLRRAMLAYAPRHEVAGLTGLEWLAWLDQGLADKPFTEGPGKSLQDLPYRRQPPDVDVDGLVEAVRRRLRTPLSRAA